MSESVAMGLQEGHRAAQMATWMGVGASEGEMEAGSLREAVGICRC